MHATDTTESRDCALVVVRLAMRPAEALFVEVAADVLAPDVMTSALDAALEKLVERFEGFEWTEPRAPCR